jgi:murein peptide amidase A
MNMTERLGRNKGGYFGERIDIGSVLRDVESAAQFHKWNAETFLILDTFKLMGLTRPALKKTDKPVRVYISTGIHGDEPAGPLAMRRLLQENRWPAHVDFFVCPCLNPTGFVAGKRENHQGLDLNRQYRSPRAEEVIAHINWLRRQPAFDLCLCLHEDWESNGFYLYELNGDKRPSLAEPIVANVSQICPIDPSEVIEGRAAKRGIIRPDIDPRSRPDWPEAFFLFTQKTRLSYTLEAPSDFPLPARIEALVRGVSTALLKLS